MTKTQKEPGTRRTTALEPVREWTVTLTIAVLVLFVAYGVTLHRADHSAAHTDSAPAASI
jgi:hypothetical protein